MNKSLRTITRTGILAMFLFFLGSYLHGQQLIAYWNFNNGANGTPWDSPIPSSVGNGEVTAGTWTWGDITYTDGFAGSTQNALFGDPSGASLSLKSEDMNGNYIQFEFSMTGFENLEISYWTRKTSTGFNNNQWSWSADGADFENFGNPVDPSANASGEVITLTVPAGLNNAATAFLRYTLDGASSASGNNRIDNLQLNATQPGAVLPPANFSASAVSTSEIELGWALNADNDPVLLAWSEDGEFGVPSGTYNAGDQISGGGTVLYSGSNTSFMHENLDPGTTYFYKAWSYDGSDYSTGVTANATTDALPAVTELPYTETFDDDLGQCYVYSVSGPTKLWNHGTFEDNGFAQINGFNSGDIEEDWLILPGINFDDYDNEVMTFDTWWRFGEDDDSNYLKLFYSSNYPGTGDPTASTWTELSFTQPANDQTWGPSGDIDLSGISGELVYIGFKYRYESGQYKWWQVDNISILGDPTGTGGIKQPAAIHIGPNPASGPVTITLPQSGSEIKVYNLTGNIVAQTTAMQKTLVLDLGSHSKGLYIIEVIPPDGSTPLRSKIILK
jgi:hypothetical protein